MSEKNTYTQENSLSYLKQSILNDFENIPRGKRLSKEELAVQDIRQLLDYIEKKINGTLNESDKAFIEERTKQWKESLKILKDRVSEN